LDKNNFTCEEATRLFDRLVDGDLGLGEEEVFKAHLATCAGCRARYALDLALIDSIRTAPEEALESVADIVVSGVAERGRRRWWLRWGVAVGAISALWLATGRFGSGVFDVAVSLLTGNFRKSPAYLALAKVAGITIDCGNTVRAMVLSGTLPRDLEAYAPQVALVALTAGALVILMMYGMGRWLGKPMEVNSWRRG
jgi:hypothetical protein